MQSRTEWETKGKRDPFQTSRPMLLKVKEPKSSQEPDDGVQIMIKTLPLSVLELQHPWRVKRHILHAEGQSDKLGRRKMSSESSQEINFCFPIELSHLRKVSRASLLAQWLRICLPMHGTQVQALGWEDPTCSGATRPVSHNYWACASGACAPQQERPQQWEARAPRWRVAPPRHN